LTIDASVSEASHRVIIAAAIGLEVFTKTGGRIIEDVNFHVVVNPRCHLTELGVNHRKDEMALKSG